jgi:ABC-type branched-subunit amino acid transport system ATPase component/branched-subunit amino acid ABC-type transport system permease component
VEKFLSLSVSGAVTGAIFSLVAAGLVLSYSATGIFNFSYGAVAFMSAFVYYQLNTGLHWPIVPAAAFVILVFAPLLGLLLDVAVFRPLARATESAKIMATVGLLIALPALTTWLNDQLVNTVGFVIPRSSDVTQVGFPSGVGPVPKIDWTLPGKVPFDSNQLSIFIAAAVVAVGLWLLMRHTPLGLQMRAVVDRADLAQTRGINQRTTSRYAWVIGMMLAALAGVVGAPIIGSLNSASFVAIEFVAAAAAVLGGLRSIPLAFVGGLLLGVAQNLVFGYATFAKDINGFNSAVPFVFLLVGLVVMARDRRRWGGSAAEEVPPPDYLADLPLWRRALPWTVAVAFLVVYVLVLADDFWVGVMATGLTLSLIFLSFVVITGLGGMVSLAQATFVLAAGLTTGMLINRYEWGFLPAMILGVAVTVALSSIVALPALRLGGLPLALATLALAFLGDQVLFQWNWLRNTQSGWTIPRPVIGPFDMNNNKTFAMFVLLLVGVVTLLIHNLKRSSWGRAIAATRSSEVAANTSGVSVLRVKLGVFALSAAIAGVGGVLYASYQQSITNLSVTVVTGLLWLATVVLFGIRRPAAAVLAGIVSAASPVILSSGFHASYLPSFLSWNGTTSAEIPAILFGLGAVQLARSPDGVISITSAQNYARRTKRKAKRAAALGVPESAIAAVVHAEDAAVTAETERQRRALISEGVVAGRGDSVEPATLVPDDDAVLVLRGVRAGYEEVEVLHGVDLVVHAGEITALLGANGSGKTTLCSTISGLVPVRAGSITVLGGDVAAQPPYQRARRGILVAPESRGIFPGLSVEENLMLRLPGPAARDQVYERFPVLRERRRLLSGSLSGGEQQMLALAPVLVDPPRIVVADEPTLGLAPRVVTQVMSVFEELRDRGTAVLLVEEKARNVLEVAGRVAFLELGHLVWSGRRAEIDDERLLATYLGAGR